MSQRKTAKLPVRAVGDLDAAPGPMDDNSTYLAGRMDAAAVEKDRAKSSGRPPLERTALVSEDHGASNRAAVEPQRKTKPRGTRHGPPPTR